MKTRHRITARKPVSEIATATELLPLKVPVRIMALNALQFTGVLTAALVIPSPETVAVLAMLPDPIAGNIGKIALAFVAAKPAINLLCDILDNGKIDDSHKQQKDFRES